MIEWGCIMANVIKVEIDGIDDVARGLEDIMKAYPSEVRKFLNKEGKKAQTKVKRAMSEQGVQSRTGNYKKAISVQKPYKYYVRNSTTKAKDSVKVYGARTKEKPGYHTHLIEYGHQKVLWGRRTDELVRGFYVYERATTTIEPEYEQACEEFIDKMLAFLE